MKNYAVESVNPETGHAVGNTEASLREAQEAVETIPLGSRVAGVLATRSTALSAMSGDEDIVRHSGKPERVTVTTPDRKARRIDSVEQFRNELHPCAALSITASGRLWTTYMLGVLSNRAAMVASLAWSVVA